jgi:hypothetical protein
MSKAINRPSARKKPSTSGERAAGLPRGSKSPEEKIISPPEKKTDQENVQTYRRLTPEESLAKIRENRLVKLRIELLFEL